MHIPTKPVREYPWYIRLFFWNQKRRYGEVLEPGMLWGRSPRVFATLALFVRGTGSEALSAVAGAEIPDHSPGLPDQSL